MKASLSGFFITYHRKSGVRLRLTFAAEAARGPFFAVPALRAILPCLGFLCRKLSTTDIDSLSYIV